MNNIKNKFPEIRYFIENPKGYELLYYKEDSIHNEYPLDVKEAKEIISTIEILEQQLKKKQDVIDRLTNIIYEIDDCRKSAGGYPSDYIDKLVCILNEDEEVEV